MGTTSDVILAPTKYRTERQALAMTLDGLIARPKGDDKAEYVRLQSVDVWFALAMAARLGYDAGVDEMGYAHIWLPFKNPEEGHLIFPIGLIEATGERPALEPVPARIEVFVQAVLADVEPKP